MLKSDEAFEQMTDIDIRPRPGGHLLVHHLLSVSRNLRLRVRTLVSGRQAPSAAGIYSSAAGQEAVALALLGRTAESREADLGLSVADA